MKLDGALVRLRVVFANGVEPLSFLEQLREGPQGLAVFCRYVLTSALLRISIKSLKETFLAAATTSLTD